MSDLNHNWYYHNIIQKQVDPTAIDESSSPQSSAKPGKDAFLSCCSFPDIKDILRKDVFEFMRAVFRSSKTSHKGLLKLDVNKKLTKGRQWTINKLYC